MKEVIFMEMFNLNNGVNVLECMVLQSEEYADEIIRRFKREYCVNDDPNELLDSIVEDMDIDGDIFPESVERIKNELSYFIGVR
jgi:hypothetical protein